jgi:hypothetical protein
MSETFVVEDVGVAVCELLGDRDSPPTVVDDDRGEAVPVLLLSFFLEDLFESFARDSWSCLTEVSKLVMVEVRHSMNIPLSV